MKGTLRLKISIWLYLLLVSTAFAQKGAPELWGQRIHDEAHLLQQETIDQLEKKLKTYEDSTSNQIAILIIQSLEGEAIENYSIHTVEKWKLGQKDKDNGVLLLISIDEHKVRIEVGQGLEGVLTDAQASRIVRNEIAPSFRRNDYDGGVNAGVNGIIKAIGGEYKAASLTSDNSTGIGIAIAFSLFFVFLLVAAFVKQARSAGKVPVVAASKRKTQGAKKQPMKGTVPVPSAGVGKSFFSSGSSGGFSGGGGRFGGGGASGGW